MSRLTRLPGRPPRLLSLPLAFSSRTLFTSSACLADKKAFSHTLLLPKTSVPLKLKNPADFEKSLRKSISDELYQWQSENNDGSPFVFIDGPPYANGNLHMGHALNKVLKDFINRHKVLRGHRVHFIPGWDCHGLPIEQKALAEAGVSHTSADPIRVRQIARATALNAIQVQKTEMRDLGIMADWDNPNATYRTMDRDFEIRQLRLFKSMVDRGHVVHRLKPTYYSPTARTALAEAELRYVDDHESRSVYVAFNVEASQMSPGLRAASEGNSAELAIWTTTPWTLPSNMYKHPINETSHAVMHANHVTTESGTGLVHMAPVHGHEDFEAFFTAGLLPEALHCAVNGEGRFDESVHPGLVGKEALSDGGEEVIRMLQDRGVLLAEEKIKHRYPYDWKTKSPTIIRATPQWFADIAGIKARAATSMQNIQFHPSISRHRLEAFVSSRSEWCISRQRSWGVPIPILFDEAGRPVLACLEHTIQVLEDRGIDHWWSGPIEDFLPTAYEGPALRKGGDTLDVWFDSGSAWTSIEDVTTDKVADVCLEGSDQHRGWFQSSLLTRLMTTDKDTPVAGTIITHGFITDESGRKMSKSEGNGISPADIVHGSTKQRALGADALRLWVASVDYTKDVSLGPNAITQASEMLRKLRSVLRFAAGNVTLETIRDAADPKTDLLDEYILCELYNLEATVLEAYEKYAFSRALLSINTYVSTLSALYFDSVKDTLYCDGLDSPRRRAVVYTLDKILHILTKVVAPLVPHLAEEINRALPTPILPTVFATKWDDQIRPNFGPAKQNMNVLLGVRQQVSDLVESCRKEKLLKSASEAEVHVTAQGEAGDLLEAHLDLLPRLFGSSQVHLASANDAIRHSDHQGVRVELTLTRQHPCPRCWRHQSESEDVLCKRCQA